MYPLCIQGRIRTMKLQDSFSITLTNRLPIIHNRVRSHRPRARLAHHRCSRNFSLISMTLVSLIIFRPLSFIFLCKIWRWCRPWQVLFALLTTRYGWIVGNIRSMSLSILISFCWNWNVRIPRLFPCGIVQELCETTRMTADMLLCRPGGGSYQVRWCLGKDWEWKFIGSRRCHCYAFS